MAAPVPPRGGARGSVASPSRSARFRGVGRDKMASPPPSARLGRDAPTGERASSTSRESGGLGHGLRLEHKLRVRTRARAAKEVSRADKPCYITSGNRAAPAKATFFPVPSHAGVRAA